MEYLAEQEKGASQSILGLSDLWEEHVWTRKVAQLKGVLLMCRMIKSLPFDIDYAITQSVKKGEMK